MTANRLARRSILAAFAASAALTLAVPAAWSIVEGRLYLNHSKSIQRRWERNRAHRIKVGDRNWPLIVAGNGRIVD